MPEQMTNCEFSFMFGAVVMAFTLFMSGFFDFVRWAVELWLKLRKEKKDGVSNE